LKEGGAGRPQKIRRKLFIQYPSMPRCHDYPDLPSTIRIQRYFHEFAVCLRIFMQMIFVLTACVYCLAGVPLTAADNSWLIPFKWLCCFRSF
jgi:hypothetical protein